MILGPLENAIGAFAVGENGRIGTVKAIARGCVIFADGSRYALDDAIVVANMALVDDVAMVVRACRWQIDAEAVIQQLKALSTYRQMRMF